MTGFREHGAHLRTRRPNKYWEPEAERLRFCRVFGKNFKTAHYPPLPTTRLTPGIVSGSERHEDTLSVSVYQILILTVLAPSPSYKMGRIAAGFVRAEQVPNANVLGDVDTARQHPPQSVNPYMPTVERIETMPRVEERPHPQLAPVLPNLEVTEKPARMVPVSKPQFDLFECRSHGRFSFER